jgi:hypothetical protein
MGFSDYSFPLSEDENYKKRQFLRRKSVIYTGVFAAYTKEELIQIFDYLMDELNLVSVPEVEPRTAPGTKVEDRVVSLFDNPYVDVLLILINYIKESNQDVSLPESRLEKLYDLVRNS